MTKRDYTDYLEDIYTSIVDIQNFTKGMEFIKFIKDKKTTYAVIRCFEIIGEASKNIPQIIRKKYVDVPWKDMAGMRDKLIHGYFSFNEEVLWKTINEDIPKLKIQFSRILKK